MPHWIDPQPRGLYIRPADAWIDPSFPAERALITHGHADHARGGHGKVWATPETLAIMGLRYGAQAGTPVAYGDGMTLGDVAISFVPAGHVLGSAQIVLEHAGEKIVVSGDYKRRHDPTCPPFQPVPCDVFITEATFGLPVFRHPETPGEIDKLLAALNAEPDRCVLVGAYALGKAQRVIAELRRQGHEKPIYIHGALERMCRLYEEFGVGLGELILATGVPAAAMRGHVVVAPPSTLNDRWSRRLPDPITAMASGWMRVRQRARQKNVELPLVISDHADWDELTDTITELTPNEIWVTHGREEALVHWATMRQMRAKALELVGREDEDEGLMRAFSNLLDRLIYTRSRNSKLDLIARYLKETPDPDRGWAMAALTGELDLPGVKPAAIRGIVAERVDPVLLSMSYDYVGDLAETVALIWPKPESWSQELDDGALSLGAIVDRLLTLGRSEAPCALAQMLDHLDANGRFALLKLATGGLRIGVSARLARTAFAQAFGLELDDVEEHWHAIAPPYAPLFDWAEGRSGKPEHRDVPIFRPFMLAHPLEELVVDLTDYAAEWKWDGIRVQLVGTGSETRLYSRGGDDVTGTFPDVAAAFPHVGVLDGELLVRGDFQGGEAASFNALQQRLGRKKVSSKMLEEYPAFVRLYDILFEGDEDLRALPWTERRNRLEALAPKLDQARFDVSTVIDATDFKALGEIRAGARDSAIEGVMLKRRDSPYVAGRRTGLWYKWKRDPLTADCVVMYAQRGHGKRSSYYSDYTFGCWTEDGELQPVGKAYSGITDEELRWLDKFVRNHTLNRFGPVREVEKTLVLEIAFDSIHESKRHKSGVAMRFPRIARIRTDKPAEEADRIGMLRRMIS